jgi:hypothetical protein
MIEKLSSVIAVIGIDISKNSFHFVGLDGRGAIVLRHRSGDRPLGGACHGPRRERWRERELPLKTDYRPPRRKQSPGRAFHIHDLSTTLNGRA